MPEQAEVIRDSGCAALAYDHRKLGTSDGEPRGEVSSWIQARGMLEPRTKDGTPLV